MMKFVVGLTLFVVLMVLVFMAGRWVERFRGGYRYEVLEETKVESDLGPIYSRTVGEAVGYRTLNTETFVLEVDRRIVYKAQRDFQEKVPILSGVRGLPPP
jgi:hypothetical protein